MEDDNGMGGAGGAPPSALSTTVDAGRLGPTNGIGGAGGAPPSHCRTGESVGVSGCKSMGSVSVAINVRNNASPNSFLPKDMFPPSVRVGTPGDPAGL